MCAPADTYHALLATDRVTFHRIDGDIETSTEIAVVPEDSAEVRRVTVTNNGDESREIELTSYGEIVLAPPESERAHPAFGNLFVETEWHEWSSAITATRRARSSKEQPLWCVHVVDSGPDRVGTVTCETDRARFIGRGAELARSHRTRATGRYRAASARCWIRSSRCGPGFDWPPVARPSVAFTTLVTQRERAFELADRYRDPHASQRALDLAWTSSRWSCGSSILRRLTRRSSRNWPAHPVLRQPGPRVPARARRNQRVPAVALGPRCERRLADSCWPRSTPRRGCRLCASFSRRTATGAAAG